jgi:hypothetical protein
MSDRPDAEISADEISQLEQPFKYFPLDPSVDGIRVRRRNIVLKDRN